MGWWWGGWAGVGACGGELSGLGGEVVGAGVVGEVRREVGDGEDVGVCGDGGGPAVGVC